MNIEQFLVGVPYQQKINYKIFKKYDNFENNAFLTCVSKGIPSPEQLEEIFTYLEPEQKLLVSLKKEQVLEHNRIIPLYEHPKNFHALFNTYIYYHTGYFDPHPRLFHECAFYGKKVIYINEHGIKDGGYFRYHDSMNADFRMGEDILYDNIFINKDVDISIIHMVTPHINGALFDVFEYFYYYLAKNKKAKLFLLFDKKFKSRLNAESIFKIFLDKYNIEPRTFDNIICTNKYSDIIKYKFDNILILDNHTYHYYDGLLLANKYHIVVDPYMPSKVCYKDLISRENHFVYSELLLYKDQL